MIASIVVAFVALIVVVEPLGVVPFFLSMTRGRSRSEVARIARRASLIGALVLLGFVLFGRALLDALGIEVHAFRVAGGLVLLLAALDMIRRTRECRCSPVEADGGRGDDVAVVPLAIPLLAGPGSMAAVMSLVGREPVSAVAVAVVLVFVVTYVVLRSAALLQRLIGPATLSVIQRVLGLLLAAMSVQAIVRGLAFLFGAYTA